MGVAAACPTVLVYITPRSFASQREARASLELVQVLILLQHGTVLLFTTNLCTDHTKYYDGEFILITAE
jgi:hypothetical protein